MAASKHSCLSYKTGGFYLSPSFPILFILKLQLITTVLFASSSPLSFVQFQHKDVLLTWSIWLHAHSEGCWTTRPCMAIRSPVCPVTDAYSPQYLLPHTKTDCSRQEFYQLEKLICDPENLGWDSMLLNNASVKKREVLDTACISLNSFRVTYSCCRQRELVLIP